VTELNVVSTIVFVLAAGLGLALAALSGSVAWLAIGLVGGAIAALSPRVAQQWERAVVLRLGRFIGLRGPGLFWIIPLVDSVSRKIDQRVITTTFAAEQTLTSDTVPVNVDAVLFWIVYDPEKAALEVQNYGQAISWAAQTARATSSDGRRWPTCCAAVTASNRNCST
jgi:regulator of protease activity HflC (stomatin/prohibitin superfamily)